MRQTCLVILASLCLCAAARAQSAPAFRQYSFHGDKRYESKVTADKLENSPDWPDTQDNPPLTSRRAVELASAQLSKLVPDAAKWEVQRIVLQPIFGKWVYVVEFIAPLPEPKAGETLLFFGGRDTFSIVVMMNGEVIEPTVESESVQSDKPKSN